MSYKPGDFLIGVSELISIVLPGAIGAYLLAGWLTEVAERVGLPVPTGAALWAALGLLAYLLGHLLFLVGSVLDPLYDRLRKRLMRGTRNRPYQVASGIMRAALGSHADTSNTYKYATAVLTLRSDAALAEVRQFEADSKFFRSLTVLAAAIAVVALARGFRWEALAAAVALGACFWRYAERRWKSTERAFQYVVVLDTLHPRSAGEPSEPTGGPNVSPHP